MRLATYKLVIAYDGTAYHGWQQQLRCPSVEAVIEETCKRVFGQEARILGASRTDAGVHALGQVVRCIIPVECVPDRFAWVLNNGLPSDIHVRKAFRVNNDFHPHRGIVSKMYYYHIFTERPLPFIARYGWYWRRTFDIEKFRTALQQFVGTHDFKLFCSAEEQRENTVRTIDAIDVRYIARFKVYRVVITGYAFLHHMIRRIVGTAMRIASHVQYQVHHINMMLNNGTIGALPVFNAPAHGLLLYAITYNTNEVCS